MRTLPYLASALLLAAIGLVDLPVSAGAHPFWSVRVVLIGTPVGLVLAFGATTMLKIRFRIILFAAIAAAALLAAHFGKAQFAASYAEDRVAGMVWYYGWIAAMAGLSALCVALLQGLMLPQRR